MRAHRMFPSGGAIAVIVIVGNALAAQELEVKLAQRNSRVPVVASQAVIQHEVGLIAPSTYNYTVAILTLGDRMKTRIVRIGNSWNVRIPKPLLIQAGLGDEVELRVEAGAIRIESVSAPRAG